MGGNGVVVNNGYASVPYFQMNYTYSGREVNGDMRLNSSSGNVEVFANGCWNMVSSHASVDLDAYTHTVIEWAKSKMEAEKKYAELAKKHPSIQEAIDAVKQAEQELEFIATIASDNSKT